MIIHFGLRLRERIDGHKLTRENYAIIDKKCSLFKSHEDYFILNNRYKKMPKKWSVWYLGKLLDYCESIAPSKRKKYLINRIEYIKNEIKAYKLLPDNYHIKVLEKDWRNDKSESLEDYVDNYLRKQHEYIDKFDWDFDILGRYYTEECCQNQYRDAMKNFDLNMEFFKLLDKDEFNKEIDNFMIRNPFFKEITDLTIYKNKSGYYILITDEYKQLYIGTSKNIAKRIRVHWNFRKQFDRLLFPMESIDKSIIPFDSFQALDTTRILVFETNKTFEIEDDFIKQFEPRFVANRIAGGVPKGLIHALSMMKSRKL